MQFLFVLQQREMPPAAPECGGLLVLLFRTTWPSECTFHLRLAWPHKLTWLCPCLCLCLSWGHLCCSTERYVYVALAGQHQVWRYDTATGVAANFSGNGYERNQNSGGALTTSWAQPSGLSLAPDGQSLFVADSESSTVRRLDLATGGGQACVGGDPMFSDNLFRFGDKDGSGSDALLQHPLAVLARPDGKGACVAEA